MKILKGSGEFFALDIGTNAIRVIQLSGGNGRWSLEHTAHVPVDSAISGSDSPEAKRRLSESIMTAIGQSGVKTRDVVIGLPSSKTFTTVVDVPNSSEAELKATMKYQVDQYIPMSAEEARVDWAPLGPSLRTQNMQEVILTSVANEYSEDRLEFIEGLGLNVIAVEPDPIAMVRALVPADNKQALMLLDMGEQSTDIAIVYGDNPRLIRTIPTGLNSLVKSTVQNLNVQQDQARQFILKFGLAPDRLEGQVLRALDASLDNFAGEITKSLKFFQTRYVNIPVAGILVSGYAATIPMFTNYLSTKSGIQTQTANPWQGIQMPQSVQVQLAPVVNEYATAVGLAKRSERL